MRLEYHPWLDSVGGPGYVLLKKEWATPALFNERGLIYWWKIRARGDEAWAKRVAEHYGIEMPEAKDE